VDTGFPKRSCSIKNLERDRDSIENDRAPGRKFGGNIPPITANVSDEAKIMPVHPNRKAPGPRLASSGPDGEETGRFSTFPMQPPPR
jgi:hypothetical protein